MLVLSSVFTYHPFGDDFPMILTIYASSMLRSAISSQKNQQAKTHPEIPAELSAARCESKFCNVANVCECQLLAGSMVQSLGLIRQLWLELIEPTIGWF